MQVRCTYSSNFPKYTAWTGQKCEMSVPIDFRVMKLPINHYLPRSYEKCSNANKCKYFSSALGAKCIPLSQSSIEIDQRVFRVLGAWKCASLFDSKLPKVAQPAFSIIATESGAEKIKVIPKFSQYRFTRFNLKLYLILEKTKALYKMYIERTKNVFFFHPRSKQEIRSRGKFSRSLSHRRRWEKMNFVECEDRLSVIGSDWNSRIVCFAGVARGAFSFSKCPRSERNDGRNRIGIKSTARTTFCRGLSYTTTHVHVEFHVNRGARRRPWKVHFFHSSLVCSAC